MTLALQKQEGKQTVTVMGNAASCARVWRGTFLGAQERLGGRPPAFPGASDMLAFLQHHGNKDNPRSVWRLVGSRYPYSRGGKVKQRQPRTVSIKIQRLECGLISSEGVKIAGTFGSATGPKSGKKLQQKTDKSHVPYTSKPRAILQGGRWTDIVRLDASSALTDKLLCTA